MALVVHKATKTDVSDPTSALRSALADFEGTLSKEQNQNTVLGRSNQMPPWLLPSLVNSIRRQAPDQEDASPRGY